MTESLPQKELATRLNISSRQVRNLVNEGMPVDHSGPRPAYPWPEAMHWYIQRQVDMAVPEHGDQAELELRKLRAEAEKKELEVAVAKRELVHLSELEAVVGETFDRVRSRLLNAPGAWSPHLVGMDTPREVLKALQPLVQEVIDELREEDWGDEVDDAA